MQMQVVTRMNGLAQDKAIAALQVEVDKLRDAVQALKTENYPIYMHDDKGAGVEVPQRQALSILANELMSVEASRKEQTKLKKPMSLLWKRIKWRCGVWS